MKKYLTILLLVLAPFALQAQSDILIDDFTVPVTEIQSAGATVSDNDTLTIDGFTNANRETSVQVQTEGVALAKTQGNVFIGGGEGALSALVALEYSGFTLDATGQNFIRLDFESSANLNALAVLLTNSGSGVTLEGVMSVPDFGSSGSYYIDIAALANYTPEFMNGIDTIKLAFSTTEPEYEFGISKVTVTAVPEPATWALLVAGLLLLGIGYARRRA